MIEPTLVTLQKQIEEVKDIAMSTHRAITGDKDIGHVGLAYRVHKSEEALGKIHDDRTKLMGGFLVITGIGMVLSPLLLEAFKHWMKFP